MINDYLREDYIMSQVGLDAKKSCTYFICATFLWTLTDSNRRPSACKADALNQLS